MKNQTNKQRRSVLLAAIAIVFLFGVFNAIFAQGIGAKYGSRNPRTCADRKLPKTGAPTPSQAAEYVICTSEQVAALGGLTLLEDVKVTAVSQGRAASANSDYDPPIDTKFPVYDIRGSFKKYFCQTESSVMLNTGKNCTLDEHPNAKGSCYKNTFGEWVCTMLDPNAKTLEYQTAPPKEVSRTTTPPTKKEIAAKNQTNNKAGQQTESKTETADKVDSGYPKPDFSVLEKWFEVVRYEYKPFERKLYVYIKPKVDGSSRPFHGFYAEFRDKDGILLQDPYFSAVSGMPGGDVAIGEMKKLEIPTPGEKALGQTATVTIKRVVE